MPKAVIFDVDGTLIDSNGQHAQAWQDAFRDFGHEIDLAALRAQIGKGGDQLLPVFLSQEEIAVRGEALEAHRALILKERYLPLIVGFPKVRELMQRLIADERRIALASSAKGNELQTYKVLAGIDDLIRTETSSDDAERSKPYPDIFEAALTRLDNPPPQDVVVVGDTPYDARAAAGAGLRTVGLLCAAGPKTTFVGPAASPSIEILPTCSRITTHLRSRAADTGSFAAARATAMMAAGNIGPAPARRPVGTADGR